MPRRKRNQGMPRNRHWEEGWLTAWHGTAEEGEGPDFISAAPNSRDARFILHVLCEEEINPLLVGEFTLIDSETGESVASSVDATSLEEYRASVQGYLRGVERMTLKSAVDYARATTAVPFEDLVLKYLRQGGMLA